MIDYPWIHIGLGLFGNALFVGGSILFLWQSTQELGTWMFIAGSSEMLLGSLGNAYVKRVTGPS